MWVLCAVKKLYIKSISHFRKPFLFRIQRSLLQEILGNASARSRPNINTMHPRRVYHAIYTQELSSPTTNNMDCLCLAPIWFQGSSLCFSAALDIILATYFSRTFASVFSRAIGLQLPRREQSFFLFLCNTAVIDSLRLSSIILLVKQ